VGEQRESQGCGERACEGMKDRVHVVSRDGLEKGCGEAFTGLKESSHNRPSSRKPPTLLQGGGKKKKGLPQKKGSCALRRIQMGGISKRTDDSVGHKAKDKLPVLRPVRITRRLRKRKSGLKEVYSKHGGGESGETAKVETKGREPGPRAYLGARRLVKKGRPMDWGTILLQAEGGGSG